MENLDNERQFLNLTVPYSVNDACELILEHSNDMIITTDREFNLTSLNTAAKQKTAYVKNGSIQYSLFDLFAQHAIQEVLSGDLNMLLEGKLRTVTFTSSNGLEHLEWKIFPLHDKLKHITGILFFIKDTTANVQHESRIGKLNKVLLEKELLLNNRAKMAETIIDASADLIMVLDKNLRFCAANKTLLKCCGKTQEDLIGKKLFECFPHMTDAEIHLKIKAAFDGTSSSIRKTLNWIRKGYFDVFITPLVYNHLVYGILVIAHDITGITSQDEELQRLHKQLKLSNTTTSAKDPLMSSLFNYGSYPMAIFDSELRLVDHNPPFMAEWNEEDGIKGKRLTDLYPQLLDTPAHEKIQELFRSDQPDPDRSAHIPLDKGQLSIIPMRNSDGVIDQLIAIVYPK